MKALVIGGTGFIGRRLVANLLESGDDVIIASRGDTGNPFGKQVRTEKVDRFNLESMKSLASRVGHTDVVYDQVGFGPEDLEKSVEAFKESTDLYVYTSSLAVYPEKGQMMQEEDFDPLNHDMKEGGIGNLGYSEGKRSAEAYIVRKAEFPVAAIRFPIVIGHDDVTGRVQFHLDRISEERSIVIPGKCGKMNFVWVEDAGRFLAWIGHNRKNGPYNAASPQISDAYDMVSRFATSMGKEAIISKEGEKSDVSPYYISEDRTVTVEKAQKEGFQFTPLEVWADKVVKNYMESGGSQKNSMDYLKDKSGK